MEKFSIVFLLVLIIVAVFFKERRVRSLRGIFFQIHIIAFVVSYLFSSLFLSFVILFLPLLIWPVYFCWIKPVNMLQWRMVSILFLVAAIISFLFIVKEMRDPVHLLLGAIVIPNSIMFPLSVASVVESKRRLRNLG